VQYAVLMALTVILNVCGHLFLKAGMMRTGGMSAEQFITDFSRVIFNPFVLVGLACYVSSVAAYMVVLSKVNLSYAYPLLMSAGYVLIVFFSWQLFGEPFGTFKWIGIVLILFGILLVGR